MGKDDMCTGRQYVHQFMDKLDINHRAETGGALRRAECTNYRCLFIKPYQSLIDNTILV